MAAIFRIIDCAPRSFNIVVGPYSFTHYMIVFNFYSSQSEETGDASEEMLPDKEDIIESEQ